MKRIFSEEIARESPEEKRRKAAIDFSSVAVPDVGLPASSLNGVKILFQPPAPIKVIVE